MANFLSKIIGTATKALRLGGVRTPFIYEVGADGLPNFWSFDVGGSQFERHSYNKYLEIGYGLNPYVYSVVNRIGETVSKLPFKFVDRTGEKVEMNSSIESFLELLENSDGGYMGLIETISIYLNVTGNLFINKKNFVGFENLPPNKLDVLHVPDVEINTLNKRVWGLPTSYTVANYGTGREILSTQNVFHCKYVNNVARTNWGLSPLYSGQIVYDASNNEFLAESSLHRNMGADGIISRDGGQGTIPLTPSEKNQFQDTFDKRTAGAGNFGKMHVTNASIKYTPLRFDSSKLKTLELNNKNLRVIAAIYNLDAKIFGDPQASAFNNYSEANISAFENCYIPHCNFIFYCLSKNLLQVDFGEAGVFMKVDKEKIPILNQRDLNLEKELREQVSAGIITINEFRAKIHPELGDIQTTTINEESQN